MSTMARFGYRPDHPRLRTQKSSRLLLGTSPTVPKSGTLEHFEAALLDQGQTGSCTGHGSAMGVHVTLAAAGTPLKFFPSPGGIYAPTRVIERGTAKTRLTDSGAMPSDVMVALSRFGVRAMQGPTPDGRNSDVWGPDDVPAGDTFNVNDEPTLAEIAASEDTLIIGEHRIDESAPDAITQLCAAIAGVVGPGRSIGIGVAVDSAFMQWNPANGPLDTPPDPKDILGGHWLDLNAFDAFASGEAGLLRGPNSWGTSWGDKGHYEVTSRWLRAAASDIYIF